MDTRQVASCPSLTDSTFLSTRKRKYVFSLLRLRPFAEIESSFTQSPTLPLHLLSSSTPRPVYQVEHRNTAQKSPSARGKPVERKHYPFVYPAGFRMASLKISEKYTYIPAQNKNKEIGVTDALLGCAMLILPVVLVLIALYYLAF